MIRAMLAVTAVLSVGPAFAQQPFSSGERSSPVLQPDRGVGRVYRPNPGFGPDDRRVPTYRPGPVYRPEPRWRLGNVCVTRRIECDMPRSRPVGADCGCRTPGGRLVFGFVR